MDSRPNRLKRLIEILETLPENRLHWIERVSDILNCPHRFVLNNESIMINKWFLSFGDGLMIHHAFSNEPFTKDKFEYALVNTAKIAGIEASFAPKGNRGYDIKINGYKYSLKTQADKFIRQDLIWISKYMELGRGDWNDKPEQLKGLVSSFLEHLNGSDKILILRCLKKAPTWKYELVEIPKQLLNKSSEGGLIMMSNSKQIPKPGYCIVGEGGIIYFRLYFDGGSERKLQVKDLRKELCNVIGVWEFEPNYLYSYE